MKKLCGNGFTMIELLVSLAIVGAVMAGTYSGFRGFSEATRASISETAVLEDVSVAMSLLRRDLQSSGWGLPKATRVVGEDGGGIDISEDDFLVDIDGNGDDDDTISTDRLFISDGLKIISDTAPNQSRGGYYPDGAVAQKDMLEVADAMAETGQKATIDATSSGSVDVSTTNVNFDTESCLGWYSGITHNLMDIRDNHAIIIGGPVAGGGFSVEGHRISAIDNAPAASKHCTSKTTGHVPAPSATVSFLSGETLGAAYVAGDAATIAVPAVAWYIKQNESDDIYWLYRNENKVLPNVVDFQVSFGLDPDWDGAEWSATVAPTTASALKTRPEHHLDFLADDDPAYPVTASSGELVDYFTRPEEVIRSLRSVWVRVTVLRTVAEQDNIAGNTVATSYVNLVNIRN